MIEFGNEYLKGMCEEPTNVDQGYDFHLSFSITSTKSTQDMSNKNVRNDTYDHRSVKTGHPVRSAIHKH
jgi:hypothetical protein